MLKDSVDQRTSCPDEVLLMTGSINPGKTRDVAVQDPKERLFQYITSLLAWIELTNIKTIVFCENTNSQYDFSRLVEFSEKKEKTLEILVFSGNIKAQKYGKGYGEGEIVKYAIQNSKYLSNSTNFYKITGRLFIKNFNEIQGKHQHIENIFQYPAFSPACDPFIHMLPSKPKTLTGYCMTGVRFLYVFFGRGKGRGPHDYTKHVVTAFYKSNVDFFKKNLMNSYRRVNEEKSYILEHIFYEDIINKNFSSFLLPQIIVGKSGSVGELYPGGDYSERLKALAKTFMPQGN